VARGSDKTPGCLQGRGEGGGGRALWHRSGRGEELAHRCCRRLDWELVAGGKRERRGIETQGGGAHGIKIG
jgi:hypothetical protein